MTTDWIADVVATLPTLCTADEAAKVLRTSGRNLRRLIVAGRIQGIRACETGSSRVLVPRVAIENYLRSLTGEK